jgi:hypothetical protein
MICAFASLRETVFFPAKTQRRKDLSKPGFIDFIREIRVDPRLKIVFEDAESKLSN